MEIGLDKQNLWRKIIVVLGTSAAVSGCVSGGGTIPTEYLEQANLNPDKLFVVDCLLPGQVRKLGTQLTYLSARRPIKTSAGECEVRGGEYVAYDRANIDTALQVWLPRAKEGDPIAQAYVGEIYERGLGTSPNYSEAARWYQLSAEQGNSRAQTNLGSLYERGQGVGVNQIVALNWYRKASGLNQDELAFTTSIRALESERDTLRNEVRLREREADTLRQELSSTQGQLSSRRSSLSQARRELEKTKFALQQKRSPTPQVITITAPASPPADNREEIAALERKLQQQEGQISKQTQELGYLQQQSSTKHAQLVAELKAAQSQSEALRTDFEFERKKADSLQAQVGDLKGQLSSRKQQLGQTEASLSVTRKQLAATLSQSSDAVNDPRVKQLEQQLAQQQAQQEQQNQEIGYLQAEAELQQAELQAQLQAANSREESLRSDASKQARERDALQEQVNAQKKLLSDSRAQLKAAVGAIRSRESKLQSLKSRAQAAEQQANAANQAETEQALAALSKAQGELASLRGERAALQSQLERREVDLKTAEDDLDIQANADTVAMRGQAEPTSSAVPTPPAVKFGRYYALIIGNNNYQFYPNLQSAQNDANAIADVLRTRYGFSTQVLQNGTRGQILSALNNFRQKLTEKDNFLLYYAGHGELDRVNKRGHWIPVDASPSDPTNWISNVAITDVLNIMSAKHAMVIADSCYSGSLARSVTTSTEGGRSAAAQGKWLQAMLNTRSRTVLTSGGLKPVLDTGGGRHSVFANELLKVLRGNKQVLEGPGLFVKVARQVKRAAAKLNVQQDPQYAPMTFAGDLGAPFFFRPVSLRGEVFGPYNEELIAMQVMAVNILGLTGSGSK